MGETFTMAPALNLQSLSAHHAEMDDQQSRVRGHVVIGLGGVGRRTIAELRRTLDTPYGSREPRILAAHYLVIDLEESLEVAASVPSSLDQAADNPAFALDMASVREYAAQLPDEVREWLGRYDAATEIGSDTAANPRRLGSLLLAAKAAQLQEWLNVHASALLEGDGQAIVHVHVVGYFAGGIGGGALTQLLVQLRRNEAMAGRSQIRVYGLLPSSGQSVSDGEEPAASVNAGALLSELAGAQKRRAVRLESGEPADLSFQRLCDEVLVISPPPETGRVVRDVRTLPEALAMTVRQRLFLGGGAVAPHGDAGLQVRQPIIAAAPKILTTAVDEIEEALSLALLQSALNQIIHANWRPGRGFVPESRPTDFAAYVRRSEVQDRWMLTVEHLIQSAPVLESDMADPHWRLLADDWKMVIERFMETAQAEPRKEWLNCVTKLWKQRFAEEFRGVGAAAFYRSRQNVRREMARSIRQRVERELLDSWRGGEWGLADLSAILEALVAFQRERIASVDDRIANTRVAEEACRVRAVAAFEQWAHLPFWTGGDKARTQLHVYCIHLQELYVNRTRAEGWLFAKTLLPVVIEELESLRQHLERLLASIRHGGHTVGLLLDSLSVRMEEDEGEPGFVVRLLDRERLRQLVRDILMDERTQLAHAETLRQVMARHGAGSDGFRGIVTWGEAGTWLKSLAAQCREQVIGPKSVWSASVRDLLDVSIYDALQARSGGDFGRLREMSALYIQQVAALLPDRAEKRLSTRLYILLPRDPANEVFIKTLKSAFSFSRPGDIRFVETDDDRGSIHMLNVTAPFSIPDVELLRQMDAKYRDYVRCDRDYAMMALHAFGGRGDAQDEFVLEDENKQATLTAAQLLIGFPLRLVLERAVADNSGRLRLWLVPRDEHGFEDEPIVLADDLLTAPQQVYGTLASLVDDNVTRALSRCGREQPAEEQERVINAVVDKVMEIRARCNGDPLDATYRSFVEAGKAAVVMIRGRWGGEDGHV